MPENVDDYLEKGMYGSKELHPEEKKQFLGTFRERVILALHKEDVIAGNYLEELTEALEANPSAVLLLNSQLSYNYLRPYIQLAEKRHHHFSVVTRKETETDVFLVLAADSAVNKATIFPTEKEKSTVEKPENQKKSFFQKVQRFWKKD